MLSQLMFANEVDPTDWDNIFFSEAVLWSRRSHDSQTQCGCVLVKNKRLPNIRPQKYPYMIHAEANAIYNCAREGKSTLGATAYITAAPCTTCLQMLWQCGIEEILFSDLSDPKSDIWTEKYNMVLREIGHRVDIKFIPKSKLDNRLLIESAEKFENFQKPLDY